MQSEGLYPYRNRVLLHSSWCGSSYRQGEVGCYLCTSSWALIQSSAGVSDQVSTCGRLSSLANLGRGGPWRGNKKIKKKEEGRNNKKQNDPKGSTEEKKTTSTVLLRASGGELRLGWWRELGRECAQHAGDSA